MKKKYGNEIKNWSIYFIAILAGIYLHEIGHAVVAWAHGKWAIPTPAKEYMFDTVSSELQQYISLGGVLGSVLFTLVILVLYIKSPRRFPQSLLAAALASPGVYCLLFALKGRGHDAAEFQEAQAAMGFSYSGHAVDYLFLLLFFGGALLWVFLSRPSLKIIPRLLLGSLLTVFFVAGAQTINNKIFDPLFEEKVSNIKSG